MNKRNRFVVLLALLAVTAAAIGSTAVLGVDDAPWWKLGDIAEAPASFEDPPYTETEIQAMQSPDFVPGDAGQVIIEPANQLQKSKSPWATGVDANIVEMRQRGYVEASSGRAKHLLALKTGPTEQAGRGLRSSTTGLKLAFTPRAGAAIPAVAVIGYEPAGAETANGWSGLTTVFMDNVHGACVYTVHHFGLVGGAVRLGEDTVEYSVRGKPTQVTVEGSEQSGFAYEVAWFEPDVQHELTCAMPRFERSHSQQLIALARRIDAGKP